VPSFIARALILFEIYRGKKTKKEPRQKRVNVGLLAFYK